MSATLPSASCLSQLAGHNVLFLNWRDPSSPEAGGAEKYCFEIARRLAAAGARMTLFTARCEGSKPVERVEGVLIVRAGGTYGVYPSAARHLLRNRHTYDVIVDFQNGIPFFSPLFLPRWTAGVCVIHHIHQRQFDVRFRFPMNAIGRLLEKQASQFVYRGRPIVTVSPSTRSGARRELGLHNPLYLVPNGGPTATGAPLPPRTTYPSIVTVSRMVPQKRTEWLIKVVSRIADTWPGLHVDIAGDGPELTRLRTMARTYGVGNLITFHGFVSEARKRELLARAWLAVVPSVAEGWGLTAIEANAVGTPVLAYDVPGLRDAVRHEQTGWLLAPSRDLTEGIEESLTTLQDADERERIARQCRAWSAAFTWDASTERLADVLMEERHRIGDHRRSRRRPSDLTVSAHFQAQDPDRTQKALAAAVRRTDRWSREGDTFSLLLNSCDEVRAATVLRRLGEGGGEGALTLASHVEELAPIGTGAP